VKPIERGEVLGLAEYEAIRDRFRARVVAEKRLRRIALGTKASALFENRDTVLLQIQEMLRTERITRPAAVDHEIETYNENLPGEGELSCTVMIEIADREEREAFLRDAVGFERHVWLVAGDRRIHARLIPHGGDLQDRTTAVHYFKFALPPEAATALRSAGEGRSAWPAVRLEVDHPAYAAQAVLPRETLAQLADDLAG
jgi:hypothetical protein